MHLKYIRNRLVSEHGMVCALCGKPIESESELTVDHIIPRAFGGATTYDNLQLAHRKCNLEKGNRYIDPETVENSTENDKKSIDKA